MDLKIITVTFRSRLVGEGHLFSAPLSRCLSSYISFLFAKIPSYGPSAYYRKKAYLDVKFMGKVKAPIIYNISFFTESSSNLYLNFKIIWQKGEIFCLDVKISKERIKEHL